MNISIQDINSAIISGNFSNDQLNSISSAVKYARSQLINTKRREFRRGYAVKFTSSRTGQVIQGVVERVKVKNILVRTTQGLWNVPANMLEAA